MDGARFANAVASPWAARRRKSPGKPAVDVLCFGGTKNGMAVGEAVVFFNRDSQRSSITAASRRGRLASKMRFLSAPWVGMLQDGAWLKHAEHANMMAEYLEKALSACAGVNLLSPRQANAVFAELPRTAIEGLWAKGWMFYTFIGAGGCRFMCSWDTRVEDVDALVSDLKPLL